MTRKHWTLLALLFTAAIPAVAHAAGVLADCGCCDACDACDAGCDCPCCD